jgi:hypothetical protein
MYGYLYIIRSGRLQDVLNDARDFLPFEDINGEMKLLSKTVIGGVVEIVNVTAIEDDKQPYASMGSDKNDKLSLIEGRYHQLIRRCHPDRFRGKEFPAELCARMDQVSQHINAHFEQIKRDKASFVPSVA